MTTTQAQRLAFVNRKGGVGKTTSAASLAIALAQRGQRVLACDMDPQANLTEALGATGAVRADRTIGHLLADAQVPITECFVDAPGVDGLQLLPSSDYLSRVEPAIQSEIGGENFLRTVLDELPAWFDWVLIDTPPTLGALTSCTLVAATRVIIPVEPEPYSVRAALKVQGTIEEMHRHKMNPGLQLDGVLFTRVASRFTLTREVRDALSQTTLPVLPVEIPASVRAMEASGRGAPITLTHPESPVAQAYQRLADHVLGATAQVAA